MQSSQRHVYLNLDALRGVAAISVMLYHFSPFITDGKVLPSSYLAVDLFFLLSGFVIAHAYDRKIESGMGFGTFLLIRLIRLYPLYLAGTLLGFFYLLIKNRLIPAEYLPLSDIAVMLTTGMFFIPLVGSAYHTIFPLNPASWSLVLRADRQHRLFPAVLRAAEKAADGAHRRQPCTVGGGRASCRHARLRHDRTDHHQRPAAGVLLVLPRRAFVPIDPGAIRAGWVSCKPAISPRSRLC